MQSFNAIKVSEEFLGALPKRVRDVIERRFGIGKSKDRKTLEAIGNSYGITRERVRQIEAYGLKKLNANDAIKEKNEVFDALRSELLKRGGIVEEEKFLSSLAKTQEEKNSIRFLLTLAQDFKRIKEGEESSGRWTADENLASACHDTRSKLHRDLEGKDPMEDVEIKTKLAQIAQTNFSQNLGPDALESWLSISKMVAQNQLGGWGLADSPRISPRGVRDLAFLVMKQHGSPMHFSEVTQAIKKNLSEPAHLQTVHNELIKDDRFVLVGRGLYALREWGYQPGTVKDVIKNILASAGPLPKEKVIEKVLKERHVKTATILINLQDKRNFKSLDDGSIALV